MKVLALVALTLQFTLSAVLVMSPIYLQQQLPIKIDMVSLCLFLSVSVSIMVGSFIGGILSDMFGRRWTIIGSMFIILVGSLILMFNTYLGYIFVGLGIGPANNLSFVYVAETMFQRQLCSMVLLCGWAMGQVILGLMFLRQNSTHQLQMLIASCLIFIMTLLTIKETDTYKMQYSRKNPLQFRRYHIKYLLLGCSLMFTMQMFYYRTQFTLNQYGVSLQLNTIIVGSCQFLADILCALVIHKLNRKVSLFIILASLLGLFVMLNLIKDRPVQTLIEGVMRILDCFAMAVLGVYLPEMFSVEDRGKAVNFIMSFGVIGGGVAPLILERTPWWTLTFFIVLSMLSVFGLKDTRKQNEIETLNEQIGSTLTQ